MISGSFDMISYFTYSIRVRNWGATKFLDNKTHGFKATRIGSVWRDIFLYKLASMDLFTRAIPYAYFGGWRFSPMVNRPHLITDQFASQSEPVMSCSDDLIFGLSLIVRSQKYSRVSILEWDLSFWRSSLNFSADARLPMESIELKIWLSSTFGHSLTVFTRGGKGVRKFSFGASSKQSPCNSAVICDVNSSYCCFPICTFWRYLSRS